MKNNFAIITVVCAMITVIACKNKTETENMENPFFTKYNTPFGVPPFNKIGTEHFLPALDSAIVLHNREIDKIIAGTEEPTFKNTIEELDRSGELLSNVYAVYSGLYSADGTDEIQAISSDFKAKYSSHSDDVYLNEDLFKKVRVIYQKKEMLGLNKEQLSLLDFYYKKFIRKGVNLTLEKKERLRNINLRLSELTIQFDKNLLAETNNFKLIIENEADLAGLPEDVINTAASTAKEKELEGKWVFTTHKPSMIPFLQYSKKKDLRKQIYDAYGNRGNNNNEFDNKKIIDEMANLRIEKANLLGFNSFAAYQLDDKMAKTPERVYSLLDEVWAAALPVAKQERAEMQAIIDAEGNDFKLGAEDWWYYSEKLRKQKYDLDENEIRPYFELSQVMSGVFNVSKKLFGLEFNEIKSDIPKPHPDVEVFEVKDADGSFLGILYLDYYTRPTKGQGAWCGTYRAQYKTEEGDVRPVVTVVTNYSNPVGDGPVLLSLDNVTTMFHEFGHALHDLLSDVTYKSISGTNVKRDFVELPSQIMENWATEKEVLQMYAKHYKTGEVMPDELIEKLTKARYFNQGFATVEYVAASYLDMNFHILKEKQELDIETFEEVYLDKIGLIPEIISRYRSTYFKHIWSHDYSAGYYSYIWAEVLDKDAFDAFLENGLFDEETANSFRENILERGGSDNPMDLYIKFRKRKPDTKPLLRSRGLL